MNVLNIKLPAVGRSELATFGLTTLFAAGSVSFAQNYDLRLLDAPADIYNSEYSASPIVSESGVVSSAYMNSSSSYRLVKWSTPTSVPTRSDKPPGVSIPQYHRVTADSDSIVSTALTRVSLGGVVTPYLDGNNAGATGSASDDGKVVGINANGNFVWTNPTTRFQLSSPSGANAFPRAITNGGRVVAQSLSGGGAFYWADYRDPAAPVRLALPSGRTSANPVAVNEDGSAVGWSFVANGNQAASFFSLNDASLLPMPDGLSSDNSRASSINNAGVIVGEAVDNDGAVIWSGGEVSRLSSITAIPGELGAVRLRSATSLNEAGVITGTAWKRNADTGRDEQRIFVLTPRTLTVDLPQESGWRAAFGGTTPLAVNDVSVSSSSTATVTFSQDAQARSVNVTSGQVVFNLAGQTLTVDTATTIQQTASLSVNNGTINSDIQVVGALGGSGIVAGDVVSSGTISPGNSPGTLTIGGDLTLRNNADFVFELGTAVDRINVTGSLIDATTGPIDAIVFDFPSHADFVPGTYTLLTFANSVDLDVAQLFWQSNIDDFTGTFQLNQTSLTFTAVVPEPATSALLAVGAITLLGRRGRRARNSVRE